MVAFPKTKKYKKTKKIRGGNRIGGNNIGSNCNDPNFSIYNTNMLKLFPYKGGKAIPPESNMELLRTPEGLEEEERQRRLEEEDEESIHNIEDISDLDLSENNDSINSDDERRRDIQNDFIRGENINDSSIHYLDDSDMSELRLSDLGGGSKQKKSKKGRKSRKSKKGRKSKKSRKARKSRKSRKRKGGNLYLDDPYKNNEGPQY